MKKFSSVDCFGVRLFNFHLAFFPSVLPITVKVATFVAGPAINKTRAAPGDKPFNINTAAIGTDAVAQTYTGIEAAKISNIFKKSLLKVDVKKSLGIIMEITAAIIIPITSH